MSCGLSAKPNRSLASARPLVLRRFIAHQARGRSLDTEVGSKRPGWIEPPALGGIDNR
jgi:hypothetical protein